MYISVDKNSYNRKWMFSFASIFLAAFFYGENDEIKPVHPLFNANTSETVKYYGYEVETHTVVTDDGYVLDIHRIPPKNQSVYSRPVFIQHGLVCSSFNWVVNPPEQSLSYALADAGYDVWLGNFRGNSYGLNHVMLSSNQSEFWDFSWDEMGRYDVPAVIDYILSETGHSKLHYVGHSMGTTTYFVMMHYKPEYNEKVESMFALGPTTTVNNIKSVLQYGVSLLEPVEYLLSLFGKFNFLADHSLAETLGHLFCKENDLTLSICEHIVHSIAGYGNQVNKTMWPVYISQTPAGTSFKTAKHYKQAITETKFQAFDYSLEGNLQVYGKPYPTQYDVTKTKTPAYFYYSLNDWFTRPEDVLTLAKKLPNIQRVHQIEDEQFNHVDFMWGKNNKELLFDDIVRTILDLDAC